VASRSAQSLLFERVVRRASGANGVSRLSAIDMAELSELEPWISVIDPDTERFALKFTRAGAGVCSMLGRDAVGLDYLEFVDPAIKGDAFDSALVMLSRPCGVWQISPIVTAEGQGAAVEYTGFPVVDDARGRGVVLMLVHHDFKPVPRITQVRSATDWMWIELRSGAGAR
jgi:hypothetical protein